MTDALGGYRRRNAAAAARDTTISRFGHFEPEPLRTHGLRDDHPALFERRTIFPSMVVEAAASARLLVGGHNNPKLGRAVRKGRRRGWPIFQLTLEERATCPTSCALWAGCYGNTMPYARRHAVGGDFLEILADELMDLALDHPAGFLVRLHTLGDFHSLAYVQFWRDALAAIPPLHVFGYTARPRSDPIGAAVLDLAATTWDRFAVRLSTSAGGARTSVVVDHEGERPEAIVCPAQTGRTAACATCGLCWSNVERPIAFLRHGMKRRGRAKPAEVRPGATALTTAIGHLPRTPPPAAPLEERILADLADGPTSIPYLVRRLQASTGGIRRALDKLAARDLVRKEQAFFAPFGRGRPSPRWSLSAPGAG